MISLIELIEKAKINEDSTHINSAKILSANVTGRISPYPMVVIVTMHQYIEAT